MSRKYHVGTIWETNNYGKIEILEKKSENQKGLTLKFLEDNTILENVSQSRVIEGHLKNPNKKIVYGKGYIGIGVFKTTSGKGKQNKEYKIWTSMLERCYNEKKLVRSPTYKDCRVDERWHNFQNFCEDLPKLENYEKWLELGGKFYHLDKDFKIKGNKIYSLNTCMFLDAKINSSLNTKRKPRSIDKYIKYNVFINGVLKFNGSSKQISEFLKIPLQTVNTRIYSKRNVKGVEILRCIQRSN